MDRTARTPANNEMPAPCKAKRIRGFQQIRESDRRHWYRAASQQAAAEDPPPRSSTSAGAFEKFLGWCVHGYTALGLVAAGLIAVLLVRGGADAFRWSFLLMAAATIVDSTDGFLARRVRIKEVVPRLRRPAAG